MGAGTGYARDEERDRVRRGGEGVGIPPRRPIAYRSSGFRRETCPTACGVRTWWSASVSHLLPTCDIWTRRLLHGRNTGEKAGEHTQQGVDVAPRFECAHLFSPDRGCGAGRRCGPCAADRIGTPHRAKVACRRREGGSADGAGAVVVGCCRPRLREGDRHARPAHPKQDREGARPEHHDDSDAGVSAGDVRVS